MSEGDSDSEAQENGTEGSSGGGTSAYGGTSGGGYPEQSTVGGPIELSNRAELRIESPRAARWRLGGYDRYTGSGWKRDSDPEPLRGPVETVESDTTRPQYEIRAEALRPFSSLATVWRPAYANADRDVFVTDQRSFVVDGRLETNETYRTITYGPPSRSEAREATGDAPPGIRERYTQLPSDTPERLGAKTAEITSGAETPYEAANAVERWLEQNKQYTLDASHNRGNDVATEFVFEMDAGYCQYFATAMTAMLRTQDIPARYVTGYTTGEQVDENTYVARGKNAHAWVEVYFDGVGWVSFDPTPGGGRIDAGRSVQPLDGQSDSGERDDKQDEQDSSTENDTEQEESSEQELPRPPYDITLSPDPIPGAEVTVTVEKDNETVAGVEVSFNGEVVGTTDDAGQLQATVPYAAELVVSAKPPEQGTSTALYGPIAGGASARGGETLFAPLPATQAGENSSTRYEIPTTATIETDRLPLSGEAVVANMSINGSAVANLAVLVGGEQVDTTDDTGTFTLPIPPDALLGEELPVRFERNDFTAEGNVTVADVSVEVETGFLKLPGTGVEVTVTAVNGDQKRSLGNVAVQLNGGTVRRVTDESGTATIVLPWSNEATATAVVGEQTVTASVSGILLHLFGVLTVVVGTLAGAGVWLYRNPERVRRFNGRVVSVLVTAGEWLHVIGQQVYAVVPALARGLRAVTFRVRSYLTRLWSEFTLAALLSPVHYVVARTADFVAWVQTLPELLSRGSSEHSRTEQSKPAESGTQDAPEKRPAYRRLRQCWRWLVRRAVRRPRTKTAVEVENRAVEKGLPRRPVRRLRRAFQDVEYGFADASERVETAEESVEQLQEDSKETEQ